MSMDVQVAESESETVLILRNESLRDRLTALAAEDDVAELAGTWPLDSAAPSSAVATLFSELLADPIFCRWLKTYRIDDGDVMPFRQRLYTDLSRILIERCRNTRVVTYLTDVPIEVRFAHGLGPSNYAIVTSSAVQTSSSSPAQTQSDSSNSSKSSQNTNATSSQDTHIRGADFQSAPSAYLVRAMLSQILTCADEFARTPGEGVQRSAS